MHIVDFIRHLSLMEGFQIEIVEHSGRVTWTIFSIVMLAVEGYNIIVLYFRITLI